MLTRRCAGRRTLKVVRSPTGKATVSCMLEGVHVGKDGKFRCDDCDAYHRRVREQKATHERGA